MQFSAQIIWANGTDINLDSSVKRGISVRMLWRQKVAKKRRRTRWVRRGFFVIPFGPNGSCRKPRLTDGSRIKVVSDNAPPNPVLYSSTRFLNALLHIQLSYLLFGRTERFLYPIVYTVVQRSALIRL